MRRRPKEGSGRPSKTRKGKAEDEKKKKYMGEGIKRRRGKKARNRLAMNKKKGGNKNTR